MRLPLDIASTIRRILQRSGLLGVVGVISVAGVAAAAAGAPVPVLAVEYSDGLLNLNLCVA